MRVAVLIGALAIVAISVLALVGTNGDEDDPPRLAPPPETADPLPNLPPGWKISTNKAIGVAVGVPPAWSSRTAVSKTILRSPESAVVVSITADRSNGAVDADLDGYALGIAGGLGRDEATATNAPKPGLGYEAGAARAGRTEVVVVRRPELAAYPMLIARNAKVKPAQLDPIVDRIVASLRGRPVSG